MAVHHISNLWVRKRQRQEVKPDNLLWLKQAKYCKNQKETKKREEMFVDVTLISLRTTSLVSRFKMPISDITVTPQSDFFLCMFFRRAVFHEHSGTCHHTSASHLSALKWTADVQLLQLSEMKACSSGVLSSWKPTDLGSSKAAAHTTVHVSTHLVAEASRDPAMSKHSVSSPGCVMRSLIISTLSRRSAGSPFKRKSEHSLNPGGPVLPGPGPPPLHASLAWLKRLLGGGGQQQQTWHASKRD